MRKMGGLSRKIPWTGGIFLVGALAMSGIFPFVGFFSKDLILEEVFMGGKVALWLIGLLTAVLTAFYMLRAHFLTFHGPPRYDEKSVRPHESPPVMLWPLRALAALTVVGGVLWVSFVGFAPLSDFLAPVFQKEIIVEGEHPALLSEGALILISLLAALLGIGIAWLVYIRGYRPAEGLRRAFRPLYTLLAGKYYVDELYDYTIVRPGRALARFLAGAFDLGVLDRAVNGVGQMIDQAGGALRTIESGYIRRYAAWVLLGTLGILIYWLMR